MLSFNQLYSVRDLISDIVSSIGVLEKTDSIWQTLIQTNGHRNSRSVLICFEEERDELPMHSLDTMHPVTHLMESRKTPVVTLAMKVRASDLPPTFLSGIESRTGCYIQLFDQEFLLKQAALHFDERPEHFAKHFPSLCHSTEDERFQNIQRVIKNLEPFDSKSVAVVHAEIERLDYCDVAILFAWLCRKRSTDQPRDWLLLTEFLGHATDKRGWAAKGILEYHLAKTLFDEETFIQSLDGEIDSAVEELMEDEADLYGAWENGTWDSEVQKGSFHLRINGASKGSLTIEGDLRIKISGLPCGGTYRASIESDISFIEDGIDDCSTKILTMENMMGL